MQIIFDFNINRYPSRLNKCFLRLFEWLNLIPQFAALILEHSNFLNMEIFVGATRRIRLNDQTTLAGIST